MVSSLGWHIFASHGFFILVAFGALICIPLYIRDIKESGPGSPAMVLC